MQREFLRLIQQNIGLIRKVCHFYATDDASRQDLFQEILIQLWKAYGSFRGEAKITTWMYRIALNTALSDIRSRNAKPLIRYVETLPYEPADEKYDDSREVKLSRLYEAIGKLSAIEKAVVMLYLEDKSYEEMQEVLGIQQGTLRVKMNRIKEKLRQYTQSEAYGT